MKAVHAAIKTQYLNMIRSGAKDTEFRDFSEYWINKLCVVPEGADMQQYRSDLINGKVKPTFKPYTHITFHCQGETLTLPITDIRVYKGHTLFAIGLDNSSLVKKKGEKK